MAWVELTAHDYHQHFPCPKACYLRSDFNMLNASKVESVRFFAYESPANLGDLRLGIVVGERNDQWHSPFSAPFGGFAYKEDVSVEDIDSSIQEIFEFAREKHRSLHIAFAPVFYDKSFLSKCVSAMFRAGFRLSYTDLNFAFDLSVNQYEDLLTKRMARRNLKTALSLNYEFRKENSPEGMAVAYEVIRQNRESKNYDLKMTFDALQKTATLVHVDYFTLYLDKVPIAAAIVYRVSPKIAQVIYWGDVPNDGKSRPMNMVAYKTFEFYKAAGYDFLDVGPSSIEGIPNVGLCSFKETIGCFVDLKYVFES